MQAIHIVTEHSNIDSDAALIAEIAAGSRVAFRRLHKSFYGRLVGFALRTGLSPDLADEAASDTLLAVWKSAARFEGRSKGSTWIFGIAYKQTMRRHRRTRLDRESVPWEDVSEITGGNVTSLQAENRTDIVAALSQLPADYRALVEMTYIWGLSVHEAAEIAGCPVGTIKSRMSRAREMLRDTLKGYGHDT